MERICVKQGNGSALLGIQVKLTNGIVSPFFSGKKLQEGTRKTPDLSMKGDINKVGFRVQQMADGQQFYTGIKLGAGGKVIAKLEFKDIGEWEYISVPPNERLVGFYGNIIDNSMVRQIGLVTMRCNTTDTWKTLEFKS